MKRIIKVDTEYVKYNMTVNTSPEVFNKTLEMNLSLNDSTIASIKLIEYE